ncbi:MAG TPA: 4-hydroxythreonine-4-phosphate dehydrogenase PdxA, partial [Planctomycetota bacterium]|nr:4-hydroxythreonine-4-phosphate dehydrogenase PdxA [Planctomycetota bacterium]
LAGAPYLRVSVIHGAGMDRAGQNRADPTSLQTALRTAAELARRWRGGIATP